MRTQTIPEQVATFRALQNWIDRTIELQKTLPFVRTFADEQIANLQAKPQVSSPAYVPDTSELGLLRNENTQLMNLLNSVGAALHYQGSHRELPAHATAVMAELESLRG